MSDIYGRVQQQNVNRASDGTAGAIRVTRDGSLLAVPWLQALCLEGRVFGASFGSASLTYTTPGTFGAAAPDMDEFDYLHTIPTTVAVIPVYYAVVYEIIGTVDFCTNLLTWGATGVISGGITATPFNMRPGAGIDSLCTVAGLGDDGGTAHVPAGLVYMSGASMVTGAATGVNTLPPFSATTCAYVPVLEGSATITQMAGFHAGQAGTGYVTSNWVELPIAMVR